MTEFTPTAKTVEVHGLELPYHWESGYPDSSFEPRSGTVFISNEQLVEVAERDQWAGAFGAMLVDLPPWAEHALEQAGLGVRETRGGVHGTDKLRELLKELKWL